MYAVGTGRSPPIYSINASFSLRSFFWLVYSSKSHDIFAWSTLTVFVSCRTWFWPSRGSFWL